MQFPSSVVARWGCGHRKGVTTDSEKVFETVKFGNVAMLLTERFESVRMVMTDLFMSRWDV